MEPPVETTLSGVIVTPFLPVIDNCLYEITGFVSVTATVTTALAVPPAPVATTVSMAEAKITVGVPEMTPVEVLNKTPVGSTLPDFKA